MTEEKALTKWCPQVQITSAQHFNDIAYDDNRDGAGNNFNCIASDCMMWRYEDTAINVMERGDGYCGLAK